MTEFPKIISVDDHVVEPAALWQDRLPAKLRSLGPRVERARWGDFSLDVGASYKQEITDDGTWGDYWLYEDRLIYVHKRHVAIPLDATPDGDVSRFDRSKMYIAAMTYDEMRPGCYEPKARIDDLAVAEVARNAARGARAICFSEIPTHLGLPSIHAGYWDALFSICQETRTTLCMHIGSSSKMPAASPDAPPSTDIMLSFNNSMASLADFLFSGVLVRFPELKLAYSEGQIGWIPYALERADNVWEFHSSWTKAKETIPEPPSTYYRGRIFGCFTNDAFGMTSINEVGEDNVCFETDYPHTDTTWPFARQEVERMTASLTDEQRYKVLRGNAIRMLDLDCI